MSLVATSLPTLWLAPPPGFVAFSHDYKIEPASIAISTILASLVFVLFAVMFSKKNRGNFLDDTSEHIEQADRKLMIGGPLGDVLRRNNATDRQPTPRLWSGFSSSNSDIVRRDPEIEGGEAAAAANRRTLELADTPARAPIFHITAPHYPNVELEVRSHSPVLSPEPPTRDVRLPPRRMPQRGNYNGSGNRNNALLQPLSVHTAPRHPRSDFGDDSTVVGDKAEVETMRSDLSFPDTEFDSASYDERRWKPMDNKAVGLLGRHWE
ncbi:hypothetical protein ACET3X_005011 [Alternaria dauci]|uniref:Uncharacterized protein n=1 Tax=Alternaria dauci TaxID=48095 RepID=A0ABR3UJ23_9PLEO